MDGIQRTSDARQPLCLPTALELCQVGNQQRTIIGWKRSVLTGTSYTASPIGPMDTTHHTWKILVPRYSLTIENSAILASFLNKLVRQTLMAVISPVRQRH